MRLPLKKSDTLKTAQLRLVGRLKKFYQALTDSQ